MSHCVLRLLQLTDTHLHASPEARMRGVNTDETFRAVLSQALLEPARPDAIVVSGDLVQDETRAGYERLRDMLQVHQLPVYCIPGNHDAPGIMGSVLSQPPFQVGGQLDVDNWCLVFLSSFRRGDDGGQLAEEELHRLENALRSDGADHFAIFLHHQPVPMGSRWLDGVGLRNADELLEVVDGSDRVRAMIWGHVHQASDRWRHGVRLLSTPSTCMQFLPNSDDFAVDDRPPGYRWIHFLANGRIDTRVAWLEDH